MDDLNLYDDLDEFQEQQERKSKELQDLEDKYQESLKSIEQLQTENKSLKKSIQKIELNFQSLLDTARAEIRRKNKEIEQLRKEKDDICFRRKIFNKGSQESVKHQVKDIAEQQCVQNPFKYNTTIDMGKISSTEVPTLPNIEIPATESNKRTRSREHERDYSNDCKRPKINRDDRDYDYHNSYKNSKTNKNDHERKEKCDYYEKHKDSSTRQDSDRNRSHDREEKKLKSRKSFEGSDLKNKDLCELPSKSSGSPERYSKRSNRSRSRDCDRYKNKNKETSRNVDKERRKSPLRKHAHHKEYVYDKYSSKSDYKSTNSENFHKTLEKCPGSEVSKNYKETDASSSISTKQNLTLPTEIIKEPDKPRCTDLVQNKIGKQLPENCKNNIEKSREVDFQKQVEVKKLKVAPTKLPLEEHDKTIHEISTNKKAEPVKQVEIVAANLKESQNVEVVNQLEVPEKGKNLEKENENDIEENKSDVPDPSILCTPRKIAIFDEIFGQSSSASGTTTGCVSTKSLLINIKSILAKSSPIADTSSAVNKTENDSDARNNTTPTKGSGVIEDNIAGEIEFTQIPGQETDNSNGSLIGNKLVVNSEEVVKEKCEQGLYFARDIVRKEEQNSVQDFNTCLIPGLDLLTTGDLEHKIPTKSASDESVETFCVNNFNKLYEQDLDKSKDKEQSLVNDNSQENVAKAHGNENQELDNTTIINSTKKNPTRMEDVCENHKTKNPSCREIVENNLITSENSQLQGIENVTALKLSEVNLDEDTIKSTLKKVTDTSFESRESSQSKSSSSNDDSLQQNYELDQNKFKILLTDENSGEPLQLKNKTTMKETDYRINTNLITSDPIILADDADPAEHSQTVLTTFVDNHQKPIKVPELQTVDSETLENETTTNSKCTSKVPLVGRQEKSIKNKIEAAELAEQRDFKTSMLHLKGIAMPHVEETISKEISKDLKGLHTVSKTAGSHLEHKIVEKKSEVVGTKLHTEETQAEDTLNEVTESSYSDLEEKQCRMIETKSHVEKIPSEIAINDSSTNINNETATQEPCNFTTMETSSENIEEQIIHNKNEIPLVEESPTETETIKDSTKMSASYWKETEVKVNETNSNIKRILCKPGIKDTSSGIQDQSQIMELHNSAVLEVPSKNSTTGVVNQNEDVSVKSPITENLVIEKQIPNPCESVVLEINNDIDTAVDSQNSEFLVQTLSHEALEKLQPCKLENIGIGNKNEITGIKSSVVEISLISATKEKSEDSENKMLHVAPTSLEASTNKISNVSKSMYIMQTCNSSVDTPKVTDSPLEDQTISNNKAIIENENHDKRATIPTTIKDGTVPAKEGNDKISENETQITKILPDHIDVETDTKNQIDTLDSSKEKKFEDIEFENTKRNHIDKSLEVLEQPTKDIRNDRQINDQLGLIPLQTISNSPKDSLSFTTEQQVINKTDTVLTSIKQTAINSETICEKPKDSLQNKEDITKTLEKSVHNECNNENDDVKITSELNSLSNQVSKHSAVCKDSSIPESLPNIESSPEKVAVNTCSTQNEVSENELSCSNINSSLDSMSKEMTKTSEDCESHKMGKGDHRLIDCESTETYTKFDEVENGEKFVDLKNITDYSGSVNDQLEIKNSVETVTSDKTLLLEADIMKLKSHNECIILNPELQTDLIAISVENPVENECIADQVTILSKETVKTGTEISNDLNDAQKLSASIQVVKTVKEIQSNPSECNLTKCEIPKTSNTHDNCTPNAECKEECITVNKDFIKSPSDKTEDKKLQPEVSTENIASSDSKPLTSHQAQCDAMATTKISKTKENSLTVSPTLSNTYNKPSALPSISTNSPTPSNFSGIFSKKSTLGISTTDDDFMKCKKKSPHLSSRPKEYILPAASVLCNVDNLENATKSSKKLHWELLDNKTEMTEIEDDSDIDTTDEERLKIKVELKTDPLHMKNVGTSLNSNVQTKVTSRKCIKSITTESDTFSEDETGYYKRKRSEIKRDQSKREYKLCSKLNSLTSKVQKPKRSQYKLPRNVKTKFKAINVRNGDTLIDVNIVKQKTFSIVLPKKQRGRPSKVSRTDVKAKMTKKLIDKVRKPKNSTEINKTSQGGNRMRDNHLEIKKEDDADISNDAHNIETQLSSTRVKNQDSGSEKVDDETLQNSNNIVDTSSADRSVDKISVNIIQNLQQPSENSSRSVPEDYSKDVCVLSNPELNNTMGARKDSIIQEKSTEVAVDHGDKHGDINNSSITSPRQDYNTDDIKIIESSGSVINKLIKETKYEKPSLEKQWGPSGLVASDSVKSCDEVPSTSRPSQEELLIKSDNVEENISSERSKSTREKPLVNTDEVKQNISSEGSRSHDSRGDKAITSKKKSNIKIKNNDKKYISLEDIGIKVRPFKGHLSSFRIPKINRDVDTTKENSWKLETFVELNKDGDHVKVEHKKQYLKDTKYDQWKMKQQDTGKSYRVVNNTINEHDNAEKFFKSYNIKHESNLEKLENKVEAKQCSKGNASNFVIQFDNKTKCKKRKLFSPDMYNQHDHEDCEETCADYNQVKTGTENNTHRSKTNPEGYEQNKAKLVNKSLRLKNKVLDTSSEEEGMIKEIVNYDDINLSNRNRKPHVKSINIYRRILDSSDEDDNQKVDIARSIVNTEVSTTQYNQDHTKSLEPVEELEKEISTDNSHTVELLTRNNSTENFGSVNNSIAEQLHENKSKESDIVCVKPIVPMGKCKKSMSVESPIDKELTEDSENVNHQSKPIKSLKMCKKLLLIKSEPEIATVSLEQQTSLSGNCSAQEELTENSKENSDVIKRHKKTKNPLKMGSNSISMESTIKAPSITLEQDDRNANELQLNKNCNEVLRCSIEDKPIDANNKDSDQNQINQPIKFIKSLKMRKKSSFVQSKELETMVKSSNISTQQFTNDSVLCEDPIETHDNSKENSFNSVEDKMEKSELNLLHCIEQKPNDVNDNRTQQKFTKICGKSTNQSHILDSSIEDNEVLIGMPTPTQQTDETLLTAATRKPKSRRKRVVKILCTSMDLQPVSANSSQQSESITEMMKSPGTHISSPNLNHPIFNTEVPTQTKEFAASMPRTPNQQDDKKFCEIDSKLHEIFQSPQYTSNFKIVQEMDALNSSELSPTQSDAKLNIGAEETDDFNRENDQSSINVSLLNETVGSLNNTSGVRSCGEVKHLSLGSAEYRFEKVSENVVNLFISRKRKRKRNN